MGIVTSPREEAPPRRQPAIRPLRLALTADPEIEVPPRFYGGVERVIDFLVRGLVARGHAVTLFAHPDSQPACPLAAYPARTSRGLVATLRNTWTVSRGVLAKEFDLVHSFGRLAYVTPLLAKGVPVLMTYQRFITRRSVNLAERLSRPGRLFFTGCSRRQLGDYAGRENWHVVHNGVPGEVYRFRPTVAADAPLAFLGRIEAIKGVDLAAQVALRSGRRLLIAGNVPPGHESYFETVVQPLLNERIVYLGPVDDAQKDDLLGRAAALLMPIRWEEPFGIVMAEALATGTPVIGLRRGAVPEVVDDGLTGFVCDTVEEMVQAVARIDELGRHACRQSMLVRFSAAAIVEQYEKLYWKILRQSALRESLLEA